MRFWQCSNIYCNGYGKDHSGVSCYWFSQGKTPADKREGRTFELSTGEPGCAECCNGDRCDDPSHYSRESCPYCLGSGRLAQLADIYNTFAPCSLICLPCLLLTDDDDDSVDDVGERKDAHEERQTHHSEERGGRNERRQTMTRKQSHAEAAKLLRQAAKLIEKAHAAANGAQTSEGIGARLHADDGQYVFLRRFTWLAEAIANDAETTECSDCGLLISACTCEWSNQEVS